MPDINELVFYRCSMETTSNLIKKRMFPNIELLTFIDSDIEKSKVFYEFPCAIWQSNDKYFWKRFDEIVMLYRIRYNSEAEKEYKKIFPVFNDLERYRSLLKSHNEYLKYGMFTL